MKSLALSLTLIIFILVNFSFPIRAQTHSPRMQVNTPEEQLAGFKVADGFVIELVASEREGVVNPIDLTFDDAGRLWTQTATMYPLDPIADIQWNDLLDLMNDAEAQKKHPNFKRILDLYQGKTKGEDKILILSNLYGKGPVQTTAWAEGLTIPQSILPYKQGAYVAQGSELFYLDDTDADGKADNRTPLFTGFGFTDTHTMSHTLVRGPGDWVHFSHGALNKGEVRSLHSDVTLNIDYSKIAKFSMDGKKLEIVSAGLNNIWGFQLRHTGEWYGSEANDLGFAVAPMEPGTGFPGIGSDRIRPYQPWMPPLHEFRVGGTGISGTAFADDSSGSFPEEYKNVAFLANPITSSINAVKIVRHPDGRVSMEHLPDLLTSEDDWFRPVNMEFGPDGCLYIADWYNKIISHNELPTTHPDRDKNHGRIWRIRHLSQKPRTIPDFYEMKTEALVDHLGSPSLWAKRAAWHQITDRQAEDLGEKLVAMAADDSKDEITRIHALWSLEGIKHYDEGLMSSLLQDPNDHLRRETVRSLATYSLSADILAGKLKNLIEDKNPTVRSQVIRTLAELENADQSTIELLVLASKPELEGNEMGGAYERKFERYLARKALEQYPKELQEFLDAPYAQEKPIENLIWALQALPEEARERAFLKFSPKANLAKIDQYTFISIAQMLENDEIYQQVKSDFHDPANAMAYTQMAVQNQAQVQSKKLAEILEVPVKTLFQKGSEEATDLALDAVGRFNIQNVSKPTVAAINDQASDKTLSLALKALENDPQSNQSVFEEVLGNKNFGFDRRASALHSLSLANPEAGEKAFQQWIPELNENQMSEMAGILSGSKEGVSVLLAAYEKQLIDPSTFDLSTAERIQQTNKLDPRGLAIMEAVKKREEDEKNAFKTKLTRYMTIAEKNDGDAVKGKVLFQTCLMCHSVGNEGQNIAPALDGSASRDHEALLTAIIDPDAAVESNYALYRVTKKDGSTAEGYLVSRDGRGTTLAFMGGSRIFIESGEIRSQGFLGGRSFMMKGLIDGYTDSQIADLLSYISTLK
jgi:putative membrane-bound dehydrogenase-like protein